jgi:hypothetical protein
MADRQSEINTYLCGEFEKPAASGSEAAIKWVRQFNPMFQSPMFKEWLNPKSQSP